MHSLPSRWRYSFIIQYLFVILICSIRCELALSKRINVEIGTVYGYIGDTVTLRCDLRYIPNSESIIWYRFDRKYYISYDENIFRDAPIDIQNRASVTCDRVYPRDICSLTITNVTSNDNGTYECGYNDGNIYFPLSSGTLIATYGQLPSEDSPGCEILILTSNGTYIPTFAQTIASDIHLRCSVEGATLKPSLFWKRENTTLTLPTSEFSLTHPVTLTSNDIGVEFTCIMNHTGLNELRFCSLTPLPLEATLALRSSAAQPYSNYPSSVSPIIRITDYSDVTVRSDLSKIQLYVFPAAISIGGILTIFAVVVILFVMCRRKRNTNNDIPIKPDYELTIDTDHGDCSVTTDYATINPSDSIDKVLGLKSVSRSSNQKPFSQRQTPLTSSTEKTDASSDDSKTHKTKPLNYGCDIPANSVLYYENFLQSPRGVPQGSNTQERVMYADLDLPVISNSNSQQIPLTNQNMTVYADIQATLY